MSKIDSAPHRVMTSNSLKHGFDDKVNLYNKLDFIESNSKNFVINKSSRVSAKDLENQLGSFNNKINSRSSLNNTATDRSVKFNDKESSRGPKNINSHINTNEIKFNMDDFEQINSNPKSYGKKESLVFNFKERDSPLTNKMSISHIPNIIVEENTKELSSPK